MPERVHILHNQLENLRNDPHRVDRLTATTPHFRTKIFTNTGCLKKPANQAIIIILLIQLKD